MNTTKTAQFTPGPWHVEYDVDGIPLTIIGNDESAIGTIETWNDHTEGNRHIIAAAPAMYEALKRIKVLMESGDIEGRDWVEYGHIINALAQAEGRQA